MKAIWDVAKATVAAVIAVKVAQNTEALIAKGGALVGKAVATGKRRLREVRAEREAKRAR